MQNIPFCSDSDVRYLCITSVSDHQISLWNSMEN